LSSGNRAVRRAASWLPPARVVIPKAASRAKNYFRSIHEQNQSENLFFARAGLLVASRAQNFRLTSRRTDRIKGTRTSHGLLFCECVVGENASCEAMRGRQ
jgi:hypothetical protein